MGIIEQVLERAKKEGLMEGLKEGKMEAAKERDYLFVKKSFSRQ